MSLGEIISTILNFKVTLTGALEFLAVVVIFILCSAALPFLSYVADKPIPNPLTLFRKKKVED